MWALGTKPRSSIREQVLLIAESSLQSQHSSFILSLQIKKKRQNRHGQSDMTATYRRWSSEPAFPWCLLKVQALGDDSDLKQRRSPFFLLRMRKPFSISVFPISLNKNWFQANYPSANVFYEPCRWFSHGVRVDNHWSETWVGAEKKLREGLLSPSQSFIAKHGEEPQSVVFWGKLHLGSTEAFPLALGSGSKSFLRYSLKVNIQEGRASGE